MSIRIGIGVDVFRGGGLDPNAQAFITAAGITDPTQQSAINALVIALKTDNLYSLGYALYPMVGGSASSHKFNLFNPINSDAAYRLNFFGGITHNANGVTSNGTNGYANTYLKPLLLNSFTMFLYSRTNINEENKYDLGSYQSSSTPNNIQTSMQIRFADFFRAALNQNNPANTPVSTSSLGFHAVSRVNNTQEIRNLRGANTTVSRTSQNIPNLNIFLMSLNFDNNAFSFSPKNYAAFGFFQGLTGAQLITLNTIINNFQTTLGRNV